MSQSGVIFQVMTQAAGPVLEAVGGSLARTQGASIIAGTVDSKPAVSSFAQSVSHYASAGSNFSWILQVPAASTLPAVFTVEALVRPAALGAEDVVRIVESATLPFSLSLGRGSQADRLTVRASFHLEHSPTGSQKIEWNRAEAPDAIQVGQWVALAAVWTGNACVVLVNGVVVARRVFKNAKWVSLLSAHSQPGIWIGTWVDGNRNRYCGDIAGVRAWSVIAPKFAQRITLAEESAIGVFDSVHADLGGNQGSLGAKVGAAVLSNGRGAQMFQKGAVVWSYETGPQVVQAPLHSAYAVSGTASAARLAQLGVPRAAEQTRSQGGTSHRVLPLEHGQLVSSPLGTFPVLGPNAVAYARPIVTNGTTLSISTVLGLPTSDRVAAGGGAQVQTFQKSGGKIYTKGNLAFEVHGLIGQKYDSLGGPGGFLGAPISDEEPVMKNGVEIGRVSRFENGAIYFSGATGAREVHGWILDHYRIEGGPAGRLGFPVTDESRAANNIVYSGFQNGVIVLHTGWSAPKTITRAELRLDRAQQQGYVIDSSGFEAVDRNGEFFGFVCVEVNGERREYVEPAGPSGGNAEQTSHRASGRPAPLLRHRFPRSEQTQAAIELNNSNLSKTLHIGRTWKFDVRHDTVVNLKIDVWDFDKASSDDYHGSHDRRLSIDNLWGMLAGERWDVATRTDGSGDDPSHGGIVSYTRSSSPIAEDEPGRHATYSKVAMTAYVRSNQRFAHNVCFDYRIVTEPPAVDKNKLREQAWWSFTNDFSVDKLTWDHFTATFPNVAQGPGVYEFIQDPLGMLYYELFKGMAKNGNCFGMSAEALRALNNIGWHTQLLHRYTLSSAGTRDRIHERQGSQIGAGMLRFVAGLLGNPVNLRADRQFDAATREIDTNGACVLSFFRLDKLLSGSFSGHAVLAYRYNRSARTLTIADPNRPFSKTSPNPSTVTVSATGTFTSDIGDGDGGVYRTGAHEVDLMLTKLRVPATVMVAVPFACAAHQQRMPNLGDFFNLLGGAISAFFCLVLGDGLPTEADVNGQLDLLPMPFAAGPADGGGYLLLRNPASVNNALRSARLRVKQRPGVSKGSFRVNLARGTSEFELIVPSTAQTDDVFRLDSRRHAAGHIEWETQDQVAKDVVVRHSVLVDPHGRPARQISTALSSARGAISSLGVEAGTGAILLRAGGPQKPLQVLVKNLDDAKAAPQLLSWTASEAPASGELLRLMPSADGRGDMVPVERLSGLGGAILDRKVLRASRLPMP